MTADAEYIIIRWHEGWRSTRFFLQHSLKTNTLAVSRHIESTQTHTYAFVRSCGAPFWKIGLMVSGCLSIIHGGR